MSVLERLVRGDDVATAAADSGTDDDGQDTLEVESTTVEGGETDSGQPTATKTAAPKRARELLRESAGLEGQCTKLAEEIRGEMEKTAAEGGDQSQQEETAAFFEKVADTIRVQRVYANSLLEQGAENARKVEALKVASDLMERDLLEPQEGQSMNDVVMELAKKDLKAVKLASEMFADAAVSRALGTAEKTASDKTSRKMDGSMSSWAESHDWLIGSP